MADLGRRHGVEARVVPEGVVRPAVMPAVRPSGPPWRVVHVASLNAVKDHETLLRALAIVVGVEPDIHLDLIGEDTLGGEAARLAHRLRLDKHVTFHGFQPTHGEKCEHMARAHVHVMSSRHEAACVSVLEAAVAGAPTVATRVGHVADGDGTRALAVPVGDSAALARGIVPASSAIRRDELRWRPRLLSGAPRTTPTGRPRRLRPSMTRCAGIAMSDSARIVTPTFFLVGAPKAGTTSFAAYLAQHPDVFVSPIKEPCLFAPEVIEIDAAARASHERDREPLRAYLDAAVLAPRDRGIVLEWTDYLKLFKGARAERAIGEASVAYLGSVDAPRRIHERVPDARILMILRDPADRLRSHYAAALRLRRGHVDILLRGSIARSNGRIAGRCD